MGFYNVQQGDVPYFKQLADTYSMSDNYHQAVNGGTGANHIMLGTGDAIWFSDGNGNPLTPPHNQIVGCRKPNAGIVDRDRKSEPAAKSATNNWYIQDGYGGGSYWLASYGGGSYTNCADTSAARRRGDRQLPKSVNVKPNCQAGHYYLLNNYNPGYYGDGSQRLRRYQQSRTIPCSRFRRRASRTSAMLSWRRNLVRLFRRPVQCVPRRSLSAITSTLIIRTATSVTSSSIRPRS